MLFDPKWEVQTKPDVFSLESLIAWLEMQPANRRYDFNCCKKCLVGRYVSAVTGDKNPSNVTVYSEMFPSTREYLRIAGTRPYTFGAALDRARKAVA